MKRNNLLVFSLLLLFAVHVCAQEPVDSVIVMGTVVDHLTDEPQPYCLLHFVQGNDTAATVRCDEEGYFLSSPLAVGAYTLSVTLKGQMVYQSDLILNDNAALHIAVITDSFSFRVMPPVDVTYMKHLLGTQQIVSPSDIRIWNLTMRKGGGDHSAAVSISPDMEPEWDELDDQEEGRVIRSLVPLGVPGKAWKYYLLDYGLVVSPSNSDMKNELLSTGRILDVRAKRSDATDTTSHEKK